MLADQSSVVGSHLLSLPLIYSKANFFTKYLYLSLPFSIYENLTSNSIFLLR